MNPFVPILRKGMQDARITQQQMFKRLQDVHGAENVPSQPGTLGAWLRNQTPLPSHYLPAMVDYINEELAALKLPALPISFRFDPGEGDVDSIGGVKPIPRKLNANIYPLVA